VAVDLEGVTAVLLPGTGSDGDYLRRAFAEPLGGAGARLVAVTPRPTGLVAGYLAALDKAGAHDPVVVGGVSLGAAVAVSWALRHPDRVVAVLAALPPWTGAPDAAPAALSARHTAALLRRDGLDTAIAAMAASSPAWLAEELGRSWRGQWPDLPGALDEAAGYTAPTAGQLGRLRPPMGVAAAADDPIHPMDVAREWASAAPHAALRTVALSTFGPEPEALGVACLEALRAAC